MFSGESITRATVWISIIAYVFGCIAFANRRAGSTFLSIARLAWTVASLALAGHFIAALHFYHHWSQLSAFQETARQTNEIYGLNWGGGLVINYAVLGFWMIDVGGWWAKGLDSYWRRSLKWILLWHGFLIFIIFNATVVFKDGLQRWLGIVICLILLIAWYLIIKQRKLDSR